MYARNFALLTGPGLYERKVKENLYTYFEIKNCGSMMAESACII